MKFISRVISPLIGNMTVFFLSWSAAGVLNLAANNKVCSLLELGKMEAVINIAFGMNSKYFLMLLSIFYIILCMLSLFVELKIKIEEIEQKFFRPFIVPVLFQISGMILGLAVGLSNNKFLMHFAISIIIIILALCIYNINALLTALKVKPT